MPRPSVSIPRPTHPAWTVTLGWSLILAAGCGEPASPEPAASSADEYTDAADGRAHPPENTPPLFLTDVTEESGLDMFITSGEMPHTLLLEAKGAGLAVIDYNNNGLWDIFVPNGATIDDTEHGPGWGFFENRGGMQFRNVTESVGITQTRWALGAGVGDLTGNGFDDIYVACFGRNVLLSNSGHGRFIENTAEAGLDHGGWSTSIALGDLTGNGFLDIYLVNYLEYDVENPPPPSQFLGTEVFSGPRGIPGRADVLFFNNGDGTFTDVTTTSGADDVIPSYGLGAVILDFDGNGRQDIYVGNDSMANFLFMNQGDGTFVERGRLSGIASNIEGNNQATMGIAIADLSGNRLPDVFTSNFSSDHNTLHVNVGGGFFEDQTRRYGLGLVSRPYLGWASAFVDLDHDGREELLVVNGHVYPHATLEQMDSPYEQPPLLFKREASHPTRFSRITDPRVGDWLMTPRRDRALAFADFDRDGDVDLLAGEINGPVRLLRNEGEKPGRWLTVQLRDERAGIANRRGLGSRIELIVDDHHMTRWIYSGGFMSVNAPEAYFGLPRGLAGAHAEVRVTWPDGTTQQETINDEFDRIVVVQRDDS